MVTCASWIRRPENAHLVVIGRLRHADSPSVLDIFSFDPLTTSLSFSPSATYVFDEGGDPVSIAVHPSGDDIVCSTTTGGCKLLELYGREANMKLLAKELLPLEGVGPQKCLGFSVDGSRFASGGSLRNISIDHLDGHLRIFEWPSLRVVLDEPRAHKSFQDMDFSLDSEFLASTSTDGVARIWNANEVVPLTTLARSSDEKIELCRFPKDGTKPLLPCSVRKGTKVVVGVWDMSTWNKIGIKRLLRKPASMVAISLDAKYLALVVLTSTAELGAMVTKLNVAADWKEWQIYLVLLGLFLASAVAFYIFFENSDSFWNFPLGRDQPARPKIEAMFGDPQSDELGAFGPLEM